MSLVTQISSAITQIGTEFKNDRAKMGDLTTLTTTAKTSLVAAINELKTTIGSGGSITADSITDATTVGKALVRATDAGTARTAIGAGTSNLAIGTSSSTAKAGDYQPAASNISDSTTTGRAILTAVDATAARTALSVYSTSATDSAISAAVAALVNGSSAALDTLKELADALGGDASFSATVSTALGNRVRVDTASQGLTGTQQGNARTNIDVYSTSQIGDPTTDFVAVLTAALA